MNKKAVKDALEGAPSGPLEAREKLEEEVTVDLNTTKTNQERNYKEFIRNEVRIEATFFMDFFMMHEVRVTMCALLYLIPGLDRPMQSAFTGYFALMLCEILLKGIHKRLTKGKTPSIRSILKALEVLSALLLLAVPSDPVIKLVIPCFLLFAMFGIMTSCLEFSDTLDELFMVKLITLSPTLVFIIQFILIQLKTSTIIEWKWFTVIVLSLIVFTFSAIASLALLTYFLGFLFSALRKKITWLKGSLSLLACSVGILLFLTWLQLGNFLLCFLALKGQRLFEGNRDQTKEIFTDESSMLFGIIFLSVNLPACFARLFFKTKVL